jgi:hypothetical protein
MMKLAQFCVSWASFFMPCAMREWDAQKGKSEIFYSDRHLLINRQPLHHGKTVILQHE